MRNCLTAYVWDYPGEPVPEETFTHSCHEEEKVFAQKTRSALRQQGLSDPIKPKYNRSRLDGQLEFFLEIHLK